MKTLIITLTTLTLTACSTIKDPCVDTTVINLTTAGLQTRIEGDKLVVWVEPYRTNQPRYCGSASGRTYIYNSQGQRQGWIAK